MKFLTLAPVAVALAFTGVTGTANASAMDYAQEAHATTVLKRQVTYSCQSGKKAVVTYGFNKQKLPTYASINASGKDRFMPLNLNRSDNVDTIFGDENNYSLMTSGSTALTLYNYHKLGANITNPASEMIYKGCKVSHVKKL